MCENFEGPEKNLLIYFSSSGTDADLRRIPRIDWDRILLEAKCAILSKTSTESTDSYILSESSLFVSKQDIVIKTCGTTALLYCLRPIVELAKEFSLTLETFCFFRKNYEFPKLQQYPHQSFSQEVEFLNKYAEEQALSTSNKAIANDSSLDASYVFLANNGNRTSSFKTRLYICMYGLDHEVSRLYYDGLCTKLVKERTAHIKKQIESAGIPLNKDDFLFNPCGYSMNALYPDGFATVHITPENKCSYASYEVDIPMDKSELQQTVNKIVGLFQPRRCSILLLCEADCHKGGPGAFLDNEKSNRTKIIAGGFQLDIVSISSTEGYKLPHKDL